MRNEESLEVVVGRLLVQRRMNLALAESCTGGLVSHRLTNVPGSSAYYLGAIVSYANGIKTAILGVQQDTLERYGAVSEQAAREMAVNVRRLFGADIGLSVTGIAGPAGGTPEKPVGLVYIGLASQDRDWVERYEWDGERCRNKARSAEAALDLLRRCLQGLL